MSGQNGEKRGKWNNEHANVSASAVERGEFEPVDIVYERTGKPGGPRVAFTREMREGIIKRAEYGFNRYTICKSVGITLIVLNRFIEEHPDFKVELKNAEISLGAECEVVLGQAGKEGDIKAAYLYLTQLYRKLNSRIDRKVKSYQWAEEHKLKVRELDLKFALFEERFGTKEGEILWDFTALGTDEDDYNSLSKRMEAGETLTAEEKMRLGGYLVRLNERHLEIKKQTNKAKLVDMSESF